MKSLVLTLPVAVPAVGSALVRRLRSMDMKVRGI